MFTGTAVHRLFDVVQTNSGKRRRSKLFFAASSSNLDQIYGGLLQDGDCSSTAELRCDDSCRALPTVCPLTDDSGTLVDVAEPFGGCAAIVAPRGMRMASVSGFERLPNTAAPMIDDPMFGLLRATPSDTGQTWLWQPLDLVETPRGMADIAFEAGADGPRDAHRAQLHEILARLDALTDLAAPLVAARLFGLPALAVGYVELEWRGACLTGRQGEFELDFSCRNRPEAIAVRFQGSQPVAVDIEA